MNIIDKKRWDKIVEANGDPYGSAVIRYAVRWADLMEREIESGKTVSEIADKTSHDADTEYITGFMYGCAVNILSGVWEHGYELKKWHNSKYNYDGDGVVNPAVISI